MIKLAVAALAVAFAVAFAGTASAGGWRSLRIDASTEDSFSSSLAAFQEELSPGRWYAFELALQDIWVKGREEAEAAQREYTASEYLRQVDGLRYKDVVRLLDPSGYTARLRYRAASGLSRAVEPGKAPPSQPGMIGFSGEQVRGIDNQAQAMQQRLADKGTLH